MSSFDVSRIVPSTRDLLGAVHMRRKELALLPLLADERIEEQLARLEPLEPRAFVMQHAGEASLRVAQSTSDTPLLVLEPAATPEDCQRARFFGADGVCLRDYAALAKVVQSMRMMPFALVTDRASAEASAGARAALLAGDLDTIVALAGSLPSSMILVARADAFTTLSSRVDAVILAENLWDEPGITW